MPSARSAPGDADGATRTSEARLPLADVVRRLQALHPRRLPRRVPDRVAVPHRVRHRRGAGRHLQRLRLLRPRLPVRRHRPAQRPRATKQGGHRPEVHALLRPARRRPDTGLRAGVPDPVDPVRRRRRAARAGQRAGGEAARAGRDGRPALRQRPRRRRRRRRRVLPAARRAGGVRPAARPGRDHQGPAAHVDAGRPRPRRPLLAVAAAVRSWGAGSERAPSDARLQDERPDIEARPARPASAPTRQAAGQRAGAAAAQSARWCPRPTFTSYYGRPIVKPPPWEHDIPAYLFTGGLAAGSSLLAAGADLTGRPGLRRAGRLGALGALSLSDGRPGPRPRQPSGSSTCCGSPSRPRRCRWAPGSSRCYGPVRRRWPPPPRSCRCCRPAIASGRLRLVAAVDRPAGLLAAAVRPAGGLVHRGAARRHRHAGLARGLPGAAVRLRRLRRRGVGGLGMVTSPGRRGRTGPPAGHGRRRARARHGAPDGAVDGLSRRAAAHRARPAADAGGARS